MSGNVPDSARNVEVRWRWGSLGSAHYFRGTEVTPHRNPGPALTVWEMKNLKANKSICHIVSLDKDHLLRVLISGTRMYDFVVFGSYPSIC